MTIPLEPKLVCDLRDVLGESRPVSGSMNFTRDGHLTTVSTTPEFGTDDEWGHFSRNAPLGEFPVTLWRISGTSVQSQQETRLAFSVPFVDFFRDGCALVVDFRGEPGQVNGLVLARDGHVETEIELGFAVHRILVDGDDCFWVGYADEADFFRIRRFKRNGSEIAQESPNTLDFWDFNELSDRLLCTCECCYDEVDVMSALLELDGRGGYRVIQERIDGWLEAVAHSEVGYILAIRRYKTTCLAGDTEVRLKLLRDGKIEDIDVNWPADIRSLQIFGRGNTLHCVFGPKWYQLTF